MASIRRKLEKKGVIAMTLLTLVLIGTACEDRIDKPEVNPTGGETVEVTLNIGFANEVDGTTRSADTKAPNNNEGNKQSAFDMQLVPASQTRAAAVATTAHPDKLYNLEIHQYDLEGGYLASTNNIESQAPGATITAKLTAPKQGEEYCQLLIIARGVTEAVETLSGKSLSQVNAVTANKTKLETAHASTGANINNMPYLLYLPKVKIVDGKLVSPEGTDVRLLLKRLAVGVSIDWTFGDSMVDKGYSLTEVRLMQVPQVYRILPETEYDPTFGTMYPKTLSAFVDGFRLTGDELTNTSSQTFWMPANARGTRNDVTNPYYRNKDYAHSAATYVEFVVNKDNERLLYRAYLGGNTTSDFNLLENTNYHWTININNANYTNDRRIQYQDLSPVISTNLQTTANCFMMLPGTNICFNPYKHEAGDGGWNTELTQGGAIANDKEITKVEVLWQSKDAGTSGDLVMGYVASKDRHTNLVNYENLKDVSKALVHVKVPVTNGGNAVIAAYHNNTIVWSWHLWISNYVPVGISQVITSEEDRKKAAAAASEACAGGSVHQYRGAAWTYSSGKFYNKVIMDRNLGALRNIWSTESSLESARAYGNLYQGGRKDPMPGSADGGRDDIDLMFDGNGVSIKFIVEKDSKNYNLAYSIEHPAIFLPSSIDNIGWSASKTIYDPCPAGWQVPAWGNESNNNIWSDFKSNSIGLANKDKMLVNGNWTKVASITVTVNDFNIMNGIRYKLSDDDSENNYAWFPFIRMREHGTGLLRDPYRNDGNGAEQDFNQNILPASFLYGITFKAGECWYSEMKYTYASGTNLTNAYGLGVRCIQK